MSFISIGTAVKDLRKEKGMTQEQLADMVGVSAQAVSKWESGGYPDAALLPNIADALGVTIDRLYGREQPFEKDMMNELAAYLCDIEQEERLDAAFEICRLICASFCGANVYNKYLFPEGIGNYQHSQVITDQGYAQASLKKDGRFFVLAPEPKNGYKSYLEYDEKYVTLFKFLAMPNALKAMYFLQMQSRSFFNSGALKTELNISEKEADELIEKMLELNFIWRSDLRGLFGKEDIYGYRLSCNFVTFMYAASLMLNIPNNFVYNMESRSKPLFFDEKNIKNKEENDTDKKG